MKYQLAVYRKDGSASGRVIEVRWPIRLTGVKRVTLTRYKPVKVKK